MPDTKSCLICDDTSATFELRSDFLRVDCPKCGLYMATPRAASIFGRKAADVRRRVLPKLKQAAGLERLLVLRTYERMEGVELRTEVEAAFWPEPAEDEVGTGPT